MRPRRREVLAGSLALMGGAAVSRAQPAPFPAGIEVDVHCHSFCTADLPIVGFVAHIIPGLTDLSRELTSWPEMIVRHVLRAVTRVTNAMPWSMDPISDVNYVRMKQRVKAALDPVKPLPEGTARDLADKVLGSLPFALGRDARATLACFVETLHLASHGRGMVAATLVETYPSVSLFTPSLVDYDAWSEDRAPTPLHTQITIQGEIARAAARGLLGRESARFHPFVAFDPRREAVRPGAPFRCGLPAPREIGPGSSALELVRHAVEEAGFLGVKVYPAVGFAPLDNARLRPAEALSPRIDQALRTFYGYCQAEEIPILTHAGASNQYGLGFAELVKPDRWIPVLEAFPHLRLDLGHFGRDHGVDEHFGAATCEAWIRQAAALCQAYPHVYADLSNSPMVHDPAYAARYGALLRDVVARFPRLGKRLMYGSDYWLNCLSPGASSFPAAIKTGLRNLLAGSARVFDDQTLADIMGRNALRFLGFLDEDNRVRNGRAAARLRRFYEAAGSTQAPGWLAS